MGSDSQDSHRKHHRSTSDDESPETSKRHKHRHHRHHRRHRHHHHHHRSKHEDAKDKEIAAEFKEVKLEDAKDIVTKKPPLDYDMEEGEIIEDEVIIEADASIAVKKLGSDVESGEFKAGDDRSDFDDSYMSVDAGGSGKSLKHLKSPGSDQSGESRDDVGQSRHEESLVLDRIANGDLANSSSKGESRSHSRHKSPRKESKKGKEIHGSSSRKPKLDTMDVDDGNDHGDRKKGNMFREATYCSPRHGRSRLESTSDMTRSESPDHRRERSQSILHDDHLKSRHHHERGERPYDNGKFVNEADDERDRRVGSYYKDDVGEKAKDIRGDKRDSSYHITSTHEEKNEVDFRDKGIREKMYREKKGVDRESNKERSERDHDRDRERERHSYRSRDSEREKDDVRDRERPRETKSDRDRGVSRDRDLDRERERRWEKDRGRSRDRALDRERRRDDSVSMHRDKDRDRARDRSLKLEMDRGRDRYSDRDRHREKARYDEDDRSRRYCNYGDRDDGYGNRDRHHGYDEAGNVKDRKTKRDSEKDQASKVDSEKGIADGIYRDDDDQNGHQEPVVQEEDDVDKIKEESRKRREAILQKYRAKQSQQQQQQSVPMVSKASDEQLMVQSPKNLVCSNTVQEDNNGIKDNGKSAMGDGNKMIAVERNTVMLGEGSPKSEKSNDMFCDDIFGDSPAGARKMGNGDGFALERSGLHDNWDDPEGYYSFRCGEILDSRYEIRAAHGKGVFSTVVRAKDLKAGTGDPEEVAIKIIRNNETMLKAGTEELVILKKLVGADPEDRRHCVRYLSHFKYRNHLCIVFESLHMNLREVLKKFGRNIGLKLTAVRTYAKQLFIALKHLRNCGVLHCDIKPDNMLVNEPKNVLKLCDFGNAMFAGKNEITPYLVSRFYRAPEIILGLPYDHPMDIWSVGCCLYELYTGKVLFPGPTNNDMLRLHMELKGPFPKKMLRKGAFIEQHFDHDLNFLAVEEDPVTKKAIRKPKVNIKPKDIGNIIRGSTGEDPKMLANFKDLLDKIFVLDPDKRLTVSQALNHPFITGK